MKESKFKEVFIFVAGTTPQIITETIYALIQQDPPVYPDEIHVITTTHGKNSLRKILLIQEGSESFARSLRYKRIF